MLAGEQEMWPAWLFVDGEEAGEVGAREAVVLTMHGTRRGARCRGGLLLIGGSRKGGVGGGRPPHRRGAPDPLAPLPREARGGEAPRTGLATKKPTGKRVRSQGSSSSRLRWRSGDGGRMDLAVAAHVLVDGWSRRR